MTTDFRMRMRFTSGYPQQRPPQLFLVPVDHADIGFFKPLATQIRVSLNHLAQLGRSSLAVMNEAESSLHVVIGHSAGSFGSGR
ncbi:hypothetical protein [Candidatus Poriferisodalis sp.]|uniref:hypothetical protein n=1 Tax=Candidatus Poriferisodalis sp. TaxID=3101277 RepID=UPI003D1014DC